MWTSARLEAVRLGLGGGGSDGGPALLRCIRLGPPYVWCLYGGLWLQGLGVFANGHDGGVRQQVVGLASGSVLLVFTECFMVFTALSVGLGLAFAAAGFGLWLGRQPDAAMAARLPRARLAGALVGVVCLVWAAYHGCLMLEGGLASYRRIVWALVPVVALLVYYHLDYLLARALGGFLVLCATYLLHGAFAEMVLWRPLYCVVCYLMGISGMLLIAAPWRFRDLLQALAQARRWRRPLGSLALAVGVVLALLPWWRRLP